MTELDKPFQPTSNFKFPSRRCGNETFSRSVTPAWFSRWKWLHYVKETDHILCFVCLKAVEKKLLPRDKFKKYNPFVNGGFSNWRKATEKFCDHEKSEMHTVAIQKLAALADVPIDARLFSIRARKQETAEHCLELLFRTIRFLGSKGIAFRGDTTRDGILYELMLERTHALPE